MPPLDQPPAPYALVLWILLALFVLRVAGQVVVVLSAPEWLPEMKQWYSGIIPYSVLLPIQLVFVAVMTATALHVTAAAGFFADQSSATGEVVVCLSLLYAGSMVVRFVRWVRTPPERRRAWIPIIFHVVLAAYLFVLGRWYIAGA